MQHPDELPWRREGRRIGRVIARGAFVIGITLGVTVGLCACQDGPSSSGDQPRGTLPADWQPFKRDSPWNLRLPSGRAEQPLPAAALSVGALEVNDKDYGIRLFVTSATDPEWALTTADYNAYDDKPSPPMPLRLHAPADLRPPAGTDGSVIVIDEPRTLGYEIWQLAVQRTGASPAARAQSVNVVDLRGSGVHRNVGLSGSGLPGIGGLLRARDMEGVKTGTPIRHKLWIAAHPDLLFSGFVAPATATDVTGTGRSAVLRYGEVIALSQSYSVESGECALSPVFQQLAHALQDFGGIVQDRGGDAIGITAEVGAFSSLLDVSEDTYWATLTCLKKHLVRIPDPWTGAQPGGLGS
jgi:hypothetical protein